MNKRVIVVEDDRSVGRVLTALLRQAGYEATHYLSAEPALVECERGAVDLAITDLRLPGIDGLEFLERARQRIPELPIIMLTAHGSVPVAVTAMKRGASDFIQKPADRDALLHIVDKALSRRHSLPPEPAPIAGAVGESDAFIEVCRQAERVARTKSTVLILGETGTGKELMARFIHDQSPRNKKDFVVTNCGALPENLIEAELFGHAKGAFTGATHARVGRVALADGGTLFLDEVGELTPSAQVKLLRVLQEGEVQPVGSAKSIRVDLRVVAATHRSLEADVRDGRFREDLYYRLAVFPLELPPLRDREGDITRLAEHFLAHNARELGRSLGFVPDALRALEAHPWPGNVRELRNTVERMSILSDTGRITEAEVEGALRHSARLTPAPPPPPTEAPIELAARRAEAEREALVEALDRCRGNRARAARLLGVSRRTLYNKLVQHTIDA